MVIQENQSLKKYNAFAVEAKAKYFAVIHTKEELFTLFINGKYDRLPRLLLGGGSNILLTKDFQGIVVKINLKGISIEKQQGDWVYVKAMAGENWHRFVLWTLNQNYGGLENLSLIPGNVGTAPVQNIGAYGVELKDVLYELTAFEIETKSIKKYSLDDCQFGYRTSIFKKMLKGKVVILSITVKLKKQNHLIWDTYGAIKNELIKKKIQHPTIKDLSKAVMTIRKQKLPNPEDIGNAGSFFKNPVISTQKLNLLRNEYPSLSFYPVNEQKVKIAAAWLIEKAGWKGKRFGDAGVHEKQALVLVNYGKATGREIMMLSQKIIEDVQAKFQIMLEREVNVL